MRIRFGVIGTNWISDRFVQSALENEEFVLSAVYSRSEEKGRDFAEKYAGASIYTDLADMAASPEVDAVYIASPNSLHAQQAILCMNHGKHVLCEKPAASNSDELRAMIEAAERSGVTFMEAMKSTLMPNFGVVKDNLYKLGRIRRYCASYGQYSSRYDAYLQGNVMNAFRPEFSNGALMDLGIYCLYPMAVLFGRPDTVKAVGVMLGSGVDGEGSILMGYPDMDAVVSYSKITDSYLPAEIQGENGTMVIDKINQPYEVKIRYRDGSTEVLSHPQTFEPMYYEIQEFIRLIRQGERQSAVNSHACSLVVSEIMEEARKQIGLKYAADRWAE
ncbi:Gfo/Idh/MocA family oxidoreductase [Paenibacillus spiritus]|uniref:Gfo/Idh/MocA family oxidoreductase n=1 Tax=Paenibacillus spiritus TaxID=2496557 RepID=A0A5J5G9H4_9BACL|nr:MULTISPECIES: Gfo/Idh/MocA family oxidoreductase [Paenibacillus]KAA9004746.1 Gfo/Idh/MocA family oxidoreductase [Paenibacillus spiritus]